MKNELKRKSLILVRGLGGTGKTALSTAISAALKIPLLNRDDVKHAVREFDLGMHLETEIGYAVMNALAQVQLRNGISVILDANSRFRSMQDFYEKIAMNNEATLYVITCHCSDEREWKRRIDWRGHNHPINFAETKAMTIEPFDFLKQFYIDTTIISLEESLQVALNWIKV